jgi:hypothetical protein
MIYRGMIECSVQEIISGFEKPKQRDQLDQPN